MAKSCRSSIGNDRIIRTLLKTITVKSPKDWYQAFRAEFFPEFWLNMYPVKMATKIFDVVAYHEVGASVPSTDVIIWSEHDCKL